MTRALSIAGLGLWITGCEARLPLISVSPLGVRVRGTAAAPAPSYPPPPPPGPPPEPAPVAARTTPAPAPPDPEPEPVRIESVTSSSVFVDPVPPEDRTVYLDVRSGVEEFDQRAFHDFVADQFKQAGKGYQIIDNPKKAHFYLAANVINLVSDRPPTPGPRHTVVTWTLTCEVQVQELAAEGEQVVRGQAGGYRNGDGGGVATVAVGRTNRKEYRTRVTTIAQGRDLAIADAQHAMFRKTAYKIAGFF